MITYNLAALLLVLMCPARGVAMDAGPPVMASPVDLWRGFDPEALPLDVEVLRSWEEGGCRFEKLRFTGEIAGGVKTRIFTIQGAPLDGKRLPGILHIHGGGQTASLDWVRFWARRGYVCVSFDFCGPWADRSEITDWGLIRQANMAQANGGLQVHPSPRESSWYHWAVAARRALTLLARHQRVDARGLGIFGISVGGNLTSMVAGSDRRVRAAVAIYGSGYNYDRSRARWGFGEQSEDLALFQRTLSPEAHAPYITCPLLHLDATNDHHAWMDDSYRLLAAVPALTRQAFTPHFIHHIEPEQGADLPLWMDWQLRAGKPFPASPLLNVGIGPGHIPIATLDRPAPETVRAVEIFYSLGDRLPPARFWRRATVSLHGSRRQAELPVADTWERVSVFANVTYTSGICLTSNLSQFVPSQLGQARATLDWNANLQDGPTGLDHWYFTASYTDPNISWKYLRIEQDGKRHYLTLNSQPFGDPMAFSISSHIVGDAAFRGRPGMSLSFECRGGFDPDGLAVIVVENDWGPNAKTYTATVQRSDWGAAWHQVTLPLTRFVAKDGKSLANWSKIDKVEISGKAAKSLPPCFGGFRWERID